MVQIFHVSKKGVKISRQLSVRHFPVWTTNCGSLTCLNHATKHRMVKSQTKGRSIVCLADCFSKTQAFVDMPFPLSTKRYGHPHPLNMIQGPEVWVMVRSYGESTRIPNTVDVVTDLAFDTKQIAVLGNNNMTTSLLLR